MKENLTLPTSYLRDANAFDAMVAELVARAGDKPGRTRNAQAIGVSHPTYWWLMEHPERPVKRAIVGTILAAFPDKTWRDLFTTAQPAPLPKWADRDLVAA